jgi:hypothetical protein
VFDLDEELARPSEVGAIIHGVTAALAAVTCQPSLAMLKGCIDSELSRFAATEARAHRHYEQPLVVPQDGQAWQLPARCIWTPHWKQ